MLGIWTDYRKKFLEIHMDTVLNDFGNARLLTNRVFGIILILHIQNIAILYSILVFTFKRKHCIVFL